MNPTEEYIGFIFENAIEYTLQDLGVICHGEDTKAAISTGKLTDEQIRYFCNTAKAAANTGELIVEQFNLFHSEFLQRYTGFKGILFVPKRSLSTDSELKTKLLHDKITKLLNPQYLSAGRQRAIDAVIDIANEIRTFDDCGHKNVEKGQPICWDIDNKTVYKPSKPTIIPPIESAASLAPPIFIAASGEGTSKPTKSVLEAYNESKPLYEPPDEMIDKEAVAAIKENTAVLKEQTTFLKERFQQPIPVYYNNEKYKPFIQEHLPDFTKGIWESEAEYAKRKGCSVKTLKKYRETNSGAVRLTEDSMYLRDGDGNILRKVNDKLNSPYEYFVHDV